MKESGLPVSPYPPELRRLLVETGPLAHFCPDLATGRYRLDLSDPR